jgi:hypothetical protein
MAKLMNIRCSSPAELAASGQVTVEKGHPLATRNRNVENGLAFSAGPYDPFNSPPVGGLSQRGVEMLDNPSDTRATIRGEFTAASLKPNEL